MINYYLSIQEHTYAWILVFLYIPLFITIFYTGRDCHPRKGGGTWLGISKTGRIASLTNVRISNADINRNSTPRG